MRHPRHVSVMVTALALAVAPACDGDDVGGPDTSCVPLQIEPAADAVLDNGCLDRSDPLVWSFEWTACERVAGYRIVVEREGSPLPLVDRELGAITSFTHAEDGFVADANRDGWSWRVRARFGALAGPWSPARPFSVEPRDSDCPGD